MKKKLVSCRHKCFYFFGFIILSMLLLATSTHAALVLFDDFEDGDHLEWLASTTGGIGSTGVELHNDSQMAHVQHTGRYRHALSRDFEYEATHMLSFDMLAVAVMGPSNTHASCGVTLSFLNSFNQTLGTVSLMNTTDPDAIGENAFAVDNTQHNYINLLADYVELAGLGAGDDISNVGIQFWAEGQSFGVHHSSANVWFDNVTVDAVPVPPTAWLFGSGLVGLVGMMRRKR